MRQTCPACERGEKGHFLSGAGPLYVSEWKTRLPAAAHIGPERTRTTLGVPGVTFCAAALCAVGMRVGQ